MRSHVRPPGTRPENEDTQHLPGLGGGAAWGSGHPSVDLHAAYELARGIAASQPETGRGHRLVWVRGAALGVGTLLAGGDAYAVVGRHTRATVVLADDPFVALRHLLVRSVDLPHGGVALRVLDLHTDLGFRLVDGSRHTAVLAEGPVVLAVGDHALVALPCPSAAGDALPAALPSPIVVDEGPPLAGGSPYRQNARVGRGSRVTLMPRPVMLGERVPESLGRLAGDAACELTLERAGQRASVELTEADLVAGVLVGRSEKCHSPALRDITAIHTSRTHLLLLREARGIGAYDLASTHGTYRAGARVHRVVLEPRHDTLTLARRESAVTVTVRS